MYARLQNPVRSSRSGSEIVVSNYTLSANLENMLRIRFDAQTIKTV
jgi:hypothetical protein